MGKDKVTIYDVAEAAEVGIGTVSRVLNNNQNVSDKTRKKVLQAIKELNYHPDGMARGLALQKSDSIGVAVPSFTDHFFVEVLRGVQAGLDESNMDLVLFKVNKEQKEKYITKLLERGKVDGILAITLDLTKDEVAKFKEKDLPLVLIDDRQNNIHSIFVNEIAGVKKAMDYLIGLGHKKIAFLDGPFRSTHGQNRLTGVKLALKEAGLEVRQGLLKEGADFDIQSGYREMKEILNLGQDKQPSAIFAASDNQAIGALEAIKEEGLSVPEDFALVGYDDIELAQYLNLTTVSQPMFKMGKMGVETLVQILCGERDEILQKEMEPELVIRSSC